MDTGLKKDSPGSLRASVRRVAHGDGNGKAGRLQSQGTLPDIVRLVSQWPN